MSVDERIADLERRQNLLMEAHEGTVEALIALLYASEEDKETARATLEKHRDE